MAATSMQLNVSTGKYIKALYQWNAASYVYYADGFDAKRDTQLPAGWSPAAAPALAVKWRVPRTWMSSDKVSFGYGGIDVIYKPPPAPHPWHNARFVGAFSLFFYDSWVQRLHKYHETHTDTKVLIYDRVYKLVYASTEGTNLVNSDGCVTRSLKDLVSRPPGVRTSCTTRRH